MKGIILAGGKGTRLYPLTLSTSKQLLPVYDKPMVYYPLTVLMLAGLREVLVISTPHDLPAFKALLGNGSQWGMHLSFTEQTEARGLADALIIAEGFLEGGPSALVLGDNLFFGYSLAARLEEIVQRDQGATIFAYPVKSPERYGVVEFDHQGRALSLEEKPAKPKSRHAVPGLYFYDGQAPGLAKQLAPSKRGELEITDLNRRYLEARALRVEALGRGTAWLDTGTHRSLLEASQFVEVMQERTGLLIGSPDEVAWRKGFIDHQGLERAIDKHGQSDYAAYLRALLA